MLFSSEEPIPERFLNPSICVVGAGAVGLTLAILLSRAGKSVTVLEAGPLHPSIDYKTQNTGVSTGRKHRGLVHGRMKAVGGTTLLWGGQLSKFDASDLKAAYGQWPIDFKTLDHHYSKIADLLNVSISASDEKRENAFIFEDLICKQHVWLKETNFFKYFKKELLSSEQIALVPNAEVAHLEFRETTLTKVLANQDKGQRLTILPKCTVLAAGTLETVRLLLETSINSKACPYKSNQNIGKYYIDHIHVVAAHVKNLDRTKARNLFEIRTKKNQKFIKKLTLSNELIAARDINNCAGSIISSASLKQYIQETIGIIRRSFTSSKNVLEAVKHTANMLRIVVPLALGYLFSGKAYNLFGDVKVGIEIEQRPSNESRLFLHPNGQSDRSEIGVHWQIGEKELQTAQVFIDTFSRFLENNRIGKVVIDQQLAAGSPEFFDKAEDAYHQMGGARMALHESDGVVDANLKVFGTSNLFIAGNAVFPSGSYANPTFTSLALADRLATHLSRRVTR